MLLAVRLVKDDWCVFSYLLKIFIQNGGNAEMLPNLIWNNNSNLMKESNFLTEFRIETTFFQIFKDFQATFGRGTLGFAVLRCCSVFCAVFR